MRFVEADTIHIDVGAGTYTVGELFALGNTLGVIQGETLVVPTGGSGVIVVAMKGASRYDDAPRNTADAAWTQGEKQYWDATNKRFTKTAGSHNLAALARVATATGDATASVILIPILQT